MPGNQTLAIVKPDAVSTGKLGAILAHLERQGYRMLVAKSAEAAIDICTGHEGPIHLIVSDVVMPHLSGPDLCRRLREIRPDVKVLYLSGYTDDKLVQNEVHDAVAGFLSKPFLPEALARKVRDVLDAQPVLR